MTNKKVTKKAKKKTTAKNARSNKDVFKIMLYDKVALRVLPVYNKMDVLQKMRIFAMLSDWMSRETIAILDEAEQAKQKPAA